MPHCYIEYTADTGISTSELLSTAHTAMIASGLFGTNDIKTRANVVTDYIMGELEQNKGGFIHITIRLLSGRTIEQKQALTHDMAQALRARLPALPSITVDIIDIVRETYAKDVV